MKDTFENFIFTTILVIVATAAAITFCYWVYCDSKRPDYYKQRHEQAVSDYMTEYNITREDAERKIRIENYRKEYEK